MVKKNPYILSTLTGLLLCLAWPPLPFAPLLFVAFVPLFLALEKIQKRAYAYIYLSFLIWNIFTTYWLCCTVFRAKSFSEGIEYFSAGLAAIVLNPVLMSIPFLLFLWVRKINKIKNPGGITLIIFWLAFEYLHFHWELSWSWLTLGHGPAKFPWLFQFYEYTGVAGGSLWILSMNILIYYLIKKWREKNSKNKFLLASVLFLVVPLIINFILHQRIDHSMNQQIIVTVVQPNIDPYDKFYELTLQQQLDNLKGLTLSAKDKHPDLIVWPETALPDFFWLDELEENDYIKQVKELSCEMNAPILTGFTLFERYDHQATESAKRSLDGKYFYDDYNAAILVAHDASTQVYTKNKLVPLVERVPFLKYLKSLGKFNIDFGGDFGNLGKKDLTNVFTYKNLRIAPLICYESIFADYVRDFILKAVNVIAVMTNDGWWGNTSGYRQHADYTNLLGVEFRRCIARSANTGRSLFVNENGYASSKTEWWKPAVITERLELNPQKTFYAKHGDYLGKICVYLSGIILIYVFILRWRKKSITKN